MPRRVRYWFSYESDVLVVVENFLYLGTMIKSQGKIKWGIANMISKAKNKKLSISNASHLKFTIPFHTHLWKR